MVCDDPRYLLIVDLRTGKEVSAENEVQYLIDHPDEARRYCRIICRECFKDFQSQGADRFGGWLQND